MSGKSHCANISPKCGRNRRPVVPKLRVPTQRHPSWGILEKSRIGLIHRPSLSQSITSPNQCPIHLPPSLILPLFSHSQLHIRSVVILVDWASSHQGADGPLLSAGLPAGPPDHQKGGDEREAKRERTGRERWGLGDSRRGCNGSDLSTRRIEFVDETDRICRRKGSDL